MRVRLLMWSLPGLFTVGVMVMVSALSAVSAARAVRAYSHPRTPTQLVPQCSDSQYSATRNPSDPLELPSYAASNPLLDAHFFVDGPAHGEAAGAIAQLLGLSPASYPDNYSWAQFRQDISPGGSLYSKLAGNPSLAHQVALLETIADQEEAQDVSVYSQGGGPGAIFSQVQKILCHNLTADPTPNTIPVFTTFMIYPNGQFCPSLAALENNTATFQRQVGELAAGIGRHPAVVLLETDAVGTSTCLDAPTLALWEADLRYEIQALTALPHTVVYLEAGAADEDSPQYVVQVLDGICVVKQNGVSVNACAPMRGLWVNATRFDWTSNEVAWAAQVVELLRNQIAHETGVPYTPHIVVNTAQNGQGPLLNPNPGQQGVENVCNPPGRGIGRLPTANTQPTSDGHFFPATDAFLWTGVPGRSYGSTCHPGDAPAGVFDVSLATGLAANASNQLGPPPAGPIPPPVLGKSVDASAASGLVLVKLPPGSGLAHTSVTQGQGFVPLTDSRQLPVGTVFDTRLGTISLTSAAAAGKGTQTGTFTGAVFGIAQDTSGATKGQTTLSLLEGTFKGAPSYSSCKGAARDVSPPGAHAALAATVLQTLHGSTHGRFRTRGRYSAAARGTAWTLSDRCDGTLTTVLQGVVQVSDFVRRVTVTVHAGHSYLASAPGSGAKRRSHVARVRVG